jgi:hypothetical protein
MPEIADVVVKIKADTRQFDRSIRRVQWSLWWMHWGPWAVIAATFLLGIAVGAVAGVVAS